MRRLSPSLEKKNWNADRSCVFSEAGTDREAPEVSRLLSIGSVLEEDSAGADKATVPFDSPALPTYTLPRIPATCIE